MAKTEEKPHDPAVRATAELQPDERIEQKFKKQGKSPASPFTPRVAVNENGFTDAERKKIDKALDILADVEQSSSTPEGAVALRSIRRDLGAA